MADKAKGIWHRFDMAAAGLRGLLDIFGLWKIMVAIMPAVVIFLWSRVRHYWGPFTFVLSLVTFAIVLELCIRLPEVIRRTVKVKLTPASGPAAIQLLNVKNYGREQVLRAECILLRRRNDPNELHRSVFRLEWDGINKRAVKLRCYGSCNLVIATAGKAEGFEWIEICGLSNESQREAKERSTWRRGHGDNYPEYDLEISIIGDSGQKAYVRIFTIKPGKISAMEMYES